MENTWNSLWANKGQHTHCRMCYNDEVYSLYEDTAVFSRIKLRRLEQDGHPYRMERLRTPIKILEGKRILGQPVGKSKDRYTEVMTKDSIRLLGTIRWKTLALDQTILGRKTDRV